jgi:hypothetical protein
VHVRVCPDCGEEYRPEIVVCAECGSLLEDHWEEEGASDRRRVAPAARPEPEPELEDHRTLFVTSHAASLVPLAERLRDAAIAFHLRESRKDARAPTSSFSLLVRPEDAARALGALAGLLDESVDPDRLEAVERAYDPARGYLSCPACSQTLAEAAGECPGCGLSLGAPTIHCPRCRQPLGPDDPHCPACGPEAGG